jgi:hypothetical protein
MLVTTECILCFFKKNSVWKHNTNLLQMAKKGVEQKSTRVSENKKLFDLLQILGVRCGAFG